MSDTPETDAAYHSSWGVDELVESEFARKIERERDALKMAILESLPELVNTPRPAYARRILQAAVNHSDYENPS